MRCEVQRIETVGTVWRMDISRNKTGFFARNNRVQKNTQNVTQQTLTYGNGMVLIDEI